MELDSFGKNNITEWTIVMFDSVSFDFRLSLIYYGLYQTTNIMLQWSQKESSNYAMSSRPSTATTLPLGTVR